MQIQVNTDRNVEGSSGLTQHVETTLKSALDRFSTRITRVEVHFSDENSQRGGTDDKRCLMEARLAGLQPIAVSHQAATIEQALDGAMGKLERSLESRLGRLGQR